MSQFLKVLVIEILEDVYACVFIHNTPYFALNVIDFEFIHFWFVFRRLTIIAPWVRITIALIYGKLNDLSNDVLDFAIEHFLIKIQNLFAVLIYWDFFGE